MCDSPLPDLHIYLDEYFFVILCLNHVKSYMSHAYTFRGIFLLT
uniref:Uncharacterized protein n=1 Tax=Anguilla anguilla TaxID=7936 RepID=A0A0E9WJ93_ANGAN